MKTETTDYDEEMERIIANEIEQGWTEASTVQKILYRKRRMAELMKYGNEH